MPVDEKPRDRANALLEEIQSDAVTSRKKAKHLEFRVSFTWWSWLASGGLAFFLGFIAAIPYVKQHVDLQPWAVSIFAAVSSSLFILRQKASLRKKSDIFYGRERADDHLIGRLRYQLPDDFDYEQVAQISQEFDKAKELFGSRMHAVNALEDEPYNSGEETTLK